MTHNHGAILFKTLTQSHKKTPHTDLPVLPVQSHHQRSSTADELQKSKGVTFIESKAKRKIPFFSAIIEMFQSEY